MQGELATIADFSDLDLNLLANLQNVVDRLDALATDQATNLGNVEQAILAWGQGDECTKRRGLDDRADEAFADLRHLRVSNLVDHLACSFSGFAGSGSNVDGAVIFDRQICAGVFLDLVDHLALRANDLTDLIHGNLDGDDARSVRAHFIRAVNSLVDQIKDGQASVAGLSKGATQDLGINTVELGVELEGGDEVLGASYLEVHVAEAVFGAENVGQGDSLLNAINFTGHEAHGDTGDGCAQRDASLEQRQGRCADGAHRGRAVGAHGLGDLADCVGEFFARWQNRDQSALCKVTVADFAALRGTHSAGFTGREGSEVVLVHVALRGDGAQVVELLFHAKHCQCGDTQDLGFATLEDGGTMDARQNLDLCGE